MEIKVCDIRLLVFLRNGICPWQHFKLGSFVCILEIMWPLDWLAPELLPFFFKYKKP